MLPTFMSASNSQLGKTSPLGPETMPEGGPFGPGRLSDWNEGIEMKVEGAPVSKQARIGLLLIWALITRRSPRLAKPIFSLAGKAAFSFEWAEHKSCNSIVWLSERRSEGEAGFCPARNALES